MFYRKYLLYLIQPMVRQSLESSLIPSHDTLIPMAHSYRVSTRFICLVSSHSIVRFLLSPLELVQARYYCMLNVS